MPVRETGRRRGVTDRGHDVVVVERTSFINCDSFEGAGEIEGTRGYVTSSGTRLNRISATVFQTVTYEPVLITITRPF
jgi:hypothetical protein